MRNDFQNWMIRKDNKTENTAYQYALSIEKINRHYFEKTMKRIDLYNSNDILLIKGIAAEYGRGGKYSDFGDTGNGTIRNAIATYCRFLDAKRKENTFDVNNDTSTYKEEYDEVLSKADQLTINNNFTYERDLQNSLIWQVESLFSGYKIFGSNQDGIEYSIGGKRIDLLLENRLENTLLAIELKSGTADFRVFGQISMYIGLLEKQFPNKKVSGIIIAGNIDESLKNACLITDKVILKKYQMQLTLEDA